MNFADKTMYSSLQAMNTRSCDSEKRIDERIEDKLSRLVEINQVNLFMI